MTVHPAPIANNAVSALSERSASPAILRPLADMSGLFPIALFDGSPDCIQLIEPDGSLAYTNPTGLRALEIEDFEPVRGRDFVELWPEDSQVRISLALAAARVGEPSRIETSTRLSDGTLRSWDLSISPVGGPNGEVVRLLSVARDVSATTEREARLLEYEHKLVELNDSLTEELRLRDVLMREIDHRVKNSLAMIASILRLQSRDTSSDEATRKLASAAARVTTVARVHERLQVADDVSVVALDKYLPKIAEDVTDALSRQGVSLDVSVEPVSVDSDKATSLGMIAAELVTNAFKHAFHGREGHVELKLERLSEDRVRMRVTDNGSGGCAIDSTGSGGVKTGLGTRIAQMHVSQIDGELDCDSPTGAGTIFTLDFPA
ncbi:MAG: histidine kinase dimerization/phosphoacceptor domain -containing protein [Litorimonas sp.]